MLSPMLVRSPVPCALAALLLLASTEAEAQATSPAQAVAEAERTLACVRGPHADIAQWMRLLGEAKATLESRTASDAARRDARESIVVLEGRIRESAAALAACAAPPRSSGGSAAPQTRAEPEPREPGPRLEAISVHVHVAPAQVVDGRGRVDAADVHDAMLRIGPALDACYEQLTERRALESGDARLVFTASGREVRSPTIEALAIGDAAFAQCVGRAARTLRLGRGSTGGEARVDVGLHFGPE